jgi:hypothetical protein
MNQKFRGKIVNQDESIIKHHLQKLKCYAKACITLQRLVNKVWITKQSTASSIGWKASCSFLTCLIPSFLTYVRISTNKI